VAKTLSAPRNLAEDRNHPYNWLLRRGPPAAALRSARRVRDGALGRLTAGPGSVRLVSYGRADD